MKKFVGILIIILSSLLMVYWIFALAMAIKWGYVFPLQPIDIIFPIVALLFISLGIFLLKKKPQEKSEISIDIDIEPKCDSCYTFLTKKEAVDHYSVERIFSGKRNGCFSKAWILFFLLLYPLIFVLLFVLGAMNQTGKAFAFVLVSFFVALILVWIGHTYMLQMNAKAKICGIVLAEQWGKDSRFPIGKEVFYIASTSDIATQMKSFSFGSKSLADRFEDQEQEKRLKDMLNSYLDTFESEEFQKKVEWEINHPNNTIEGWLVTPMREARLGRIGFWGTKVSFKDRRGTKRSCIIYRDFKDYKEIKKLIKCINES